MRFRHIGVLVGFFVVVGLAVAGYRWIHHGFSARDRPSALEGFVAGRVRSLSVPSSAVNARNPIVLTPEVLTEARAHFAGHCATCHANDGSGKTGMGQNLYPKAPDMRLPETQKLTDGEIYYIIHNGVRLTGMPAWGPEEGDDLDSWKLVHFIRHLPKITLEETHEMEALNPKSPSEFAEEQENERFLNEQPEDKKPATGHEDNRQMPATKPPQHRH